jgi:hypothetical protein
MQIGTRTKDDIKRYIVTPRMTKNQSIGAERTVRQFLRFSRGQSWSRGAEKMESGMKISILYALSVLSKIEIHSKPNPLMFDHFHMSFYLSCI